MGYKTILVHCDATKGAPNRIRIALDVARQHGAHLVGLHVRQPFQAPVFADMTAAMDALYASYEKTANTDEAAAAAVFRDLVAGASSEWRTVTGLAEDCLVEAGRYADLIVLGQYDPDAPLAATSSDLVERVAMATERPVLIVPHIGTTRTPGGNVMICWNGRREAVRAVTAALPILKAAVKVTLLMIDPEKSSAAAEPGAEIIQWLARHGVKAHRQHDSAEGSDIGGVILSRAADRDIDLIVMGIYGHSRVREMVLGGASRTLLASMTVPLLAAH
jgi:nucleotide-binding universal stress UspA family protein